MMSYHTNPVLFLLWSYGYSARRIMRAFLQ